MDQYPRRPTVEESTQIRKVQVEGLVVLKLVNHCHSSLPAMVTGQLLGLDVEDTLEVTGCFPLIYRDDNQFRTDQQEEELEKERSEYQYEMMKQLREVNVDTNIVGWYCSAWMESMLSTVIIETQFRNQSKLGSNCVCLVYDPLKTTQGKLSLRALRLKETFMALYKTQDFSQETIREKKFVADDIFEELPLEIHNNCLADTFVGELARDRDFMAQAAAEISSDLGTTGYIVKSLEGVVDSIDDLWQALQRFTMETRRFKMMQDPERTKPSRLESLLISKQVFNHCSDLEEITMRNFESLYFADTLQKVGAVASDAQ